TCVEKVIIYLEGYKKSPLHLLFREEDNLKFKPDPEKEKWCVGYPDDGVIWLYHNKEGKESVQINLNRPAVIAALIEYFKENGWKPKEHSTPLLFEDALKFLDSIDLPKRILEIQGTKYKQMVVRTL
ncbi:MAG: hypothetical protein AAFR87_35785, partial [Bacteroidota bacterium]